MATNAIATPEQLAIEGVKRLLNIVVGLSNDVFKEGVDFGAIPGTGDKPVLLQPGMEKLLRALHLRAEYIERSKVEDFDKSLFFYRYECRLIDWETGICIGTAIGSANSHESKWRWRDQKRTCPRCGKETINRSKFPPKGAPEGTDPGWYCYAKIGGCGAEFSAIDKQITGQIIGRIENPDIFDQMNTCDKIAQKRALGSAVKTVANVSMLYTVDLEDFQPYEMRQAPGDYIDGTVIEVKRENAPQPPPAPSAPQPPIAPPNASPAGSGDSPRPTPAASPATEPTPNGAQNGGSAKAEFFPDEAPPAVTPSADGFKRYLVHEIVVNEMPNGGRQYVAKSEIGDNIVTYGGEAFQDAGFDTSKWAANSKPNKVDPAAVVEAKFENKKWIVKSVEVVG